MSDSIRAELEVITVRPALKIWLYAGIVLLLLPVIFYAVYLDNAIFAVGGRVLLNGGHLYVDFLDMKPPVIYYLYAIPEFLFPGSAIALRTFDFLWQVALAFSVIFVVTKTTGNERAAFAAAGIYSIAYTVLYHSATMQCESFAGLAFIWIFYLHSREKSFLKALIIGLLIGFCIGLKYTFGIILVAVFFHDLVGKRNSIPTLIRHYSIVAAGIIISLSAIFYFLFLGYAQNYFDFLQYTSAYASFPPFDSSFFMHYFQKQIELFFYNYSFLFTLSAIFGAGLLFLKEKFSGAHRLLYLSAISAFFLWISIIVERKFFTYHFSRLYVPLSILAGFGMVYFTPHIIRIFKSSAFSLKIVWIITGVFFLTTGPFFPWLLYIRIPYYYFKNEQRYNEMFERSNDSRFTLRQQQLNIVDYFVEIKENKGKIYITGIETARLAYLLKEYPSSKFATAQFYLGEGSRSEWKADALKEIQQSDWLIIQNDDRKPIVYGHNFSSWEAMQRDSNFSKVIATEFHRDTTFDSYHIFRKVSSDAAPTP